MIELSWLRFFIATVMLSIASYYDLRTREIDDLIWFVFGTIGAFLYMFDWESFSPHVFFWISFSVIVACLLWLCKWYGGADVLAITVLSIILPTYDNVPVPMIVLLIAFVTASTYVIIYNTYRNTKSLIKNKMLFSEINEPYYKKIIAFFVMHEKSNNERFGFCGVDREQHFIFKHSPNTEEFAIGKYVTVTPPLMFFLLIGLMLLMFLAAK